MRHFSCKFKSRVFAIDGTRLKGGRWTSLRNRWMRLNPSCQKCGKPGEEVHHIIPRAQRPDLCYDINNLATLCRECHAAHHARDGQNPHY